MTAPESDAVSSRPPRNFTRPELDFIREAALLGYTPHQIANRLERSERSVRARMKGHGIAVHTTRREEGQ